MPAATVGINDVLDSVYHAATTRYVGLISSSGFTNLASNDTMSSHAGWTEATTYTSATRPAWDEDAASNAAIANSTPLEFVFNAETSIIGIFLCTDSTKGGTTGTLQTGTRWLFSSARTYQSGQKFRPTVGIMGSM